MKAVPNTIFKILLLTVFFCWYPSQGFGQQRGKSRYLLWQSGGSHLLSKDYFHAPFTYQGTNWQIGMAYEVETSQHVLSIRSNYSRGSFQSAVSVKARNQIIDLEMGYLFRMGNQLMVERKSTFYLGGTLKSMALLVNYSPDLAQSTNQVTWNTSLNLSGSIIHQLKGPHRVAFGCYTPLFAMVYRPDYPINGKDDVGYTWVGKSPTIGAWLTYQYGLGMNWQTVITYQLDYFEYDKPQPIYFLRQSLTLGLRKSF